MRYLFVILLSLQWCFAEKSKPAAPDCDPKATALWIASVVRVRDGKVLLAGKEPDKFLESRLPFAKPTEIQLSGRQIIADQSGLYPLLIGFTEQGDYEFKMFTPFYPFFDEIIAADGLPGYALHPKAEAMTEKGFRVIAEHLHSHFTASIGSKPLCFIVRDDGEGWPSEHYVWSLGAFHIILTAYNGNDSNGIYLTLTSKPDRLAKLQKMTRTTEEVFEGWGKSLPNQQPAPTK
jgi:hypothetical protein